MGLRHLMWFCILARVSGSIFQLADMVTAATGKEWSLYTSYGCYCGAGNSGTNVTVDCSDGCCEVHDNGYGELIEIDCSPYWTVYKFTLHPITCLDNISSCARRLCEQDRLLVSCLARWQHSYSSAYINVRYTSCGRENINYYNKSMCRFDDVSTEPTAVAHGQTSYQRFSSSTVPPSLLPAGTSLSQYYPSANQSTSSTKRAASPQPLSTVEPVAVLPVHAGVLSGPEYVTSQGSADARGSVQPIACMTVLGYCRVFSLAELLMWITVVTILFTIGAVLCFCSGLVMSPHKQGLCRAPPTCSCCCFGRMFRYQKLPSSSDLPDALYEL